MSDPRLSHSVERTIVIRARRATVFAYFTDTKRFASWWGEGSSVEPVVGGKIRICYPGGVTASGEVVELGAGDRIVFTYGYDDPGKAIPPGGSRVTIQLADHRDGTRVTLRHDLADAAVGEAHVLGWRYQLAIFSRIVADEEHAGLTGVVDRYLAAWSETDAAARRRALSASVADDFEFRDAYGCTTGLDEIVAHVGAAQQHLGRNALVREGTPRHCQGTAVFDWVARGADGSEVARGTNVADLAPGGRLRRVVGFWGQ